MLELNPKYLEGDDEFSKMLDIKATYDYCKAVLESTNEMLKHLKFADLKKKFTEEDKIQLRQKLGIGENDVTMLFTGRVVEEKRVIELFEVISRVLQKRQNVKMIFVGAGGASYDLEKATARRNLKDKIIFRLISVIIIS